MDTPRALPTNLMHARRNSSCPSCGSAIAAGEVIGQFGYREAYLCAGCTGRALAFLAPVDPVDAVVEDIKTEARLRRLLDLEFPDVVVVADDHGLSWSDDESLPEGTVIVAQVRVVEDYLLVTRPVRLEPYTIVEPPG